MSDPKTIVITGASAGVGAAAARRMHQHGWNVVVVGRSPEKTAAVARELGVEPLVADFAKLAEVRRLAEEIKARAPHIDVLANNAGGVFPKHVITEDGHDLTFQVNHLAGFLLTELLKDRCDRVLNTASIANNFGRVKLDDLDWNDRRWSSFRAYGTAKLENVLHAAELARREPNLLALSFHPGNIASDFARDSKGIGLLYRTPLKKVFLVPPTTGGDVLVALATRDDLQQYNGGYFNMFSENGRTNPQAKDAGLARGLWEASERLI